MTMTDKQFFAVWGAALVEDDRDAYVSDWALSSLFAPEDGDQAIAPQLIDQLGNIWDVAHMSIQSMRRTTDLSQAAFAERFCIPKRTLEDWEGHRRNPPDYVRLMLAQLLGVIER